MFDEAESIIEDYEKTNSPSPVMYSKYFQCKNVLYLFLSPRLISVALLSGARNVRDTNLSDRIYKKM